MQTLQDIKDRFEFSTEIMEIIKNSLTQQTLSLCESN